MLLTVALILCTRSISTPEIYPMQREISNPGLTHMRMRIRNEILESKTPSNISKLKLAYSIPLLIDPDSEENQESTLFCQLFTIIHILRQGDKEIFHREGYPAPPDIVVPIHHISNPSYRPSANITEEAKRLRVRLIFGGPCGISPLTGLKNLSLYDYHSSERAPFMMLNSFALTDYDRVVHLDLNVYPHPEAVEFFWHHSFNQVPNSLWGYYFSVNAPITRALLLIWPNNEAYTEMCRILDAGFGGPDGGWDHSGRFETTWCDMPYLGCHEPRRWTFTRAGMEVGVIYYYYHVQNQQWLGAANLIRENKFVFYSSNRKPWLHYYGKVWKPSWYSWEDDFLDMIRASPNDELCLSVKAEVEKWPTPRKRLQFYQFDELFETLPLPGFYIIQ